MRLKVDPYNFCSSINFEYIEKDGTWTKCVEFLLFQDFGPNTNDSTGTNDPSVQHHSGELHHFPRTRTSDAGQASSVRVGSASLALLDFQLPMGYGTNWFSRNNITAHRLDYLSSISFDGTGGVSSGARRGIRPNRHRADRIVSLARVLRVRLIFRYFWLKWNVSHSAWPFVRSFTSFRSFSKLRPSRSSSSAPVHSFWPHSLQSPYHFCST